jgi:hypothetical protein
MEEGHRWLVESRVVAWGVVVPFTRHFGELVQARDDV